MYARAHRPWMQYGLHCRSKLENLRTSESFPSVCELTSIEVGTFRAILCGGLEDLKFKSKVIYWSVVVAWIVQWPGCTYQEIVHPLSKTSAFRVPF